MAYLAAFDRLSPSRPSGFAPGAIPVSEILAYGQALGFDDLQELLDRVRACDRVFLDWLAQRKNPATPADSMAEAMAGRTWTPL